MKTLPKVFLVVATGATLPMMVNADIAWTGAANDGGNVLTDGNWDGGTVPGASDRAQIGDAPEAVLSGSWAPQYLDIGTTAGKTGTLTVGSGGELSVTTVSDGATVAAGSVRMGAADGAAAVLNIDGGTMTVHSLNTPNYAATSTVNMASGTFNVNGWLDWGRNANGLATFNHTGGIVNMGGNLYIGRQNSGTAIYNIYDGAILNHTAGVFALGFTESADGRFVQHGGTVSVTANDILVGRDCTGSYTMDGGILSAPGIMIGSESTGNGTFEQNDGTAFVAGGIKFGGTSKGGIGGAVSLNGGTLYTSSIRKTNARSSVAFNGGTVVASNVTDGANFITSIDNVAYGAGGATIDTAGYDVVFTNNVVASAHGRSTFTKSGNGSLTVDALPPTSKVTVEQGTLAVVPEADVPSSVVPVLAHRWSFAGDYADSIAGGEASPIGSSLSFADGKVTLEGNGNSTGSINLGTSLVSGKSVTIEIWGNRNTVINNMRLFDWGSGTGDGQYIAMAWNDNPLIWVRKRADSSVISDCFQTGETYHIAMTIKANGDGTSSIHFVRRNVDNPADVKVCDETVSNWDLSYVAAGPFYLGHSQWSTEKDANATYDEVRIWEGVLSDEAIAASCGFGPDATDAQLAEVANLVVVPGLSHRWSFTENYVDSVGGGGAVQIGSNVALSDGKVTMSGTGHGAGSLNLGTNLLDTATATIEIWARHDAVKKWARVFDYGPDDTHYFTMAWTHGTTAGKHRVDSKYGGSKLEVYVDDTTQPYALGTEYYIVATLEKSGDATIAKWQRRDVTTGETLLTGTFTIPAGVHTFTDPVLYLGHSQFTSDLDANATYDEVRVWNCVLSDEAIAKSVAYGPDATTAQLATLTGTSIEIAPGATLDLGGNSFSAPALAPGGTLANGTLTVTKSLKLTAGQTLTVASGATLDLSAVSEASLKDASSTIPAGGWVVATSPAGGIVSDRTQLKLAGDLAGYTLFVTPTQARIGKVGLIITIY